MAEELKIRGRIEIDVDDEGLLAVLRFIPDEEGSEFDKTAINRLIAEKKIVYGINRTELDARLDSLLASSEDLTITIAEGDSPESSSATEYSWAETAIPENLKDDVARVLKNAAPPEIIRVEVEKVKQEKTVKKKGLLSFGRERAETVTELVKREKKIRVDVAPEILEAGWVENGAKIAEIKPGKYGAAGKDVFGRPIASFRPDDEFWLVRGIDTKGGVLLAAETGILRRGLNWVEVLPFKSHDWTLELSRDKNTCLLNFNPGGVESSLPDSAEIINRAQLLGCAPDTLLSESKINEIINTSIAAGKVLKGVIISTDDDGFFEIRVSDDKLKAEMDMHKGRGRGEPLVLKKAGAAIKTSGFTGLDLKKIQEIILEFYRGPETDIIIPLAKGSGAEDGEAGTLVYELEFVKDSVFEDIKKRIPGLSEDYLNTIESLSDFPPADANAFSMVQEDQIIAGVEVNEGKKGTDVYGKEIASAAPDLSGYRALENVKIADGKIVTECCGLLERFEKDGITAFRIRAHNNASINIAIAADKMTATISVVPAVGTGLPPSLEDANRLIAEAGVTAGINAEALRSAVDKGREGETVSGALIAMGKAPKNAGDMRLKFLINLADGQPVSIDEDGRANYRNQNRITSVREGEIVAEIQVVEGESEDGHDVCGTVLAARTLTPLNLEVGANIKEEKDEKGDTFLIAAKSGRVIYENNKLEIQENLFIKGDVDFGSGNIKFIGDVNIKGNVRSGFFVMAGGNIAVGMNSEMSLLSSDKTIMVAQGVKGGGKAILRAKESIQLSFAERATLLAVENVTVKNAVFGCKVKCNGKLKLVSDKGYLVGGRIQAREGVEAANIGSIAGSRTEVSFGQDYLISDRIETEDKEINKIKARLIKIDSEMRDAEKVADKKKLALLRTEKVKLIKIMEKRSMRVFALKERFEQHFPGEIIIRGEVFPGVVFESHGRKLEISKCEKALKIVFNQETGMLEKQPVKNKDDLIKED